MNELIRMLQEREDISFEEAQYYLKKANGDIDKAVCLIQKRRNSWFTRFVQKCKDIFSSFWRYRIVICREDRMFLNIPLFVFGLFLLLFDSAGLTFTVFMLLLTAGIVLSGAEFSLIKQEPPKMSVKVSKESTDGDRGYVGYRTAVQSQPVYSAEDKYRPLPMPEHIENGSYPLQQDDYSEIIIK